MKAMKGVKNMTYKKKFENIQWFTPKKRNLRWAYETLQNYLVPMQRGETLLQIQSQKLCRKGPGDPGGHQTEHDPALSACIKG